MWQNSIFDKNYDFKMWQNSKDLMLKNSKTTKIEEKKSKNLECEKIQKTLNVRILDNSKCDKTKKIPHMGDKASLNRCG